MALFDNLIKNKDANFGNGRTVNNIFEKAISNQANRIIEIINPTKGDLITIDVKDLQIIE